MQNKTKTQKLVWVGLMAALVAVLSPFVIPVGPIPITLGTFAVFFVGAMLPPLTGVAALAVYILIGVVGLPVFSGFRSGPQVLVGPTGGYILGYFAITLAVGWAVKLGWGFWLQLAAAAVGLAVCYLFGTLWYMAVSGLDFWAGFSLCVAPFILPDALKGLAAISLAAAIQKRMRLTGGAVR